MLLGTRKVTAPDGTEWRVSVDWHRAHVRLPSAWRRRKKKDDGGSSGFDILDAFTVGDSIVSALVAAVVIIVAGLLLWFLIWPLLAIAAELMIAATAIVAGAVFRTAFGRPWLIEAEAEDRATQRWAVRGVGSANRCIHEIADALAAGLAPAPADAQPVSGS